nr:MAG TPA: hypothetical protein [Caudoviricetes sp.]
MVALFILICRNGGSGRHDSLRNRWIYSCEFESRFLYQERKGKCF